jgi:hypothetical protein
MDNFEKTEDMQFYEGICTAVNTLKNQLKLDSTSVTHPAVVKLIKDTTKILDSERLSWKRCRSFEEHQIAQYQIRPAQIIKKIIQLFFECCRICSCDTKAINANPDHYIIL